MRVRDYSVQSALQRRFQRILDHGGNESHLVTGRCWQLTDHFQQTVNQIGDFLILRHGRVTGHTVRKLQRMRWIYSPIAYRLLNPRM